MAGARRGRAGMPWYCAGAGDPPERKVCDGGRVVRRHGVASRGGGDPPQRKIRSVITASSAAFRREHPPIGAWPSTKGLARRTQTREECSSTTRTPHHLRYGVALRKRVDSLSALGVLRGKSSLRPRTTPRPRIARRLRVAAERDRCEGFRCAGRPAALCAEEEVQWLGGECLEASIVGEFHERKHVRAGFCGQ